MKKSENIGSLVILGVFLILSFMGFTYYKYIINPPPTLETEEAIASLAAAKESEAKKYAQNQLQEAQMLFDKAMVEWELENQKWMNRRDFNGVRQMMIQVDLLAKEALLKASEKKDTTGGHLDLQLKKIQNELNVFEEKYKRLPLDKKIFEDYGRSKMLFVEASHYFNQQEYPEAEKTLLEAQQMISQLLEAAQDKLAAYFKDLPLWRKQAETARKLSKNGQVVLLINKLESTCSILKAGKVMAIYPTEFGRNWLGDKVFMGDHKTPEGIYKVVQMKKGSKTNYYKSLLLNYPNEEDEKRFAERIKQGQIPKQSKIGGLIQIHGFGGKGVHWTEGCVALENDNMDKVYKMVQLNTPVIIIGSEQSLNDYLK